MEESIEKGAVIACQPFRFLSADQKVKLEELKSKLCDVLDSNKHYDEYVFRFLKARNFDVSKAETMFRNMIRWKKENDVENIMKEFPNHHEFQSLHNYWPAAMCGKSIDGAPVFIERIGQVDPKSLFGHVSNEALLKYHIWTVESHENVRFEDFRMRGFSSPLYIIQDAKGLGLKHAYRPAIEFIGKLAKIDQDNYPEMILKMCFINTPAVFGTLFSLVKPLVDPVTLSKIEVLGYNYLPKLTESICLDQLPSILGGSKDMHFPLAGEFESHLKRDGTSVVVPAGETLRYSVSAVTGSVLRYHFKTEGYNIGFGVCYKPAENSLEEKWILPSCKVDSQTEPIADSVIAENDGIYFFEFDNRFSRWRAKTLLFLVAVEPPVDEESVLASLVPAGPSSLPASPIASKNRKRSVHSEPKRVSSEKVARKAPRGTAFLSSATSYSNSPSSPNDQD